MHQRGGLHQGLCVRPLGRHQAASASAAVGPADWREGRVFRGSRCLREWNTLVNTWESLHGPIHTGMHVKSEDFNGLMFAKFRSQLDCDTAVATLRSAKIR